MNIINAIRLMICFLPAPVQVLIFVILAILVIFVIFKIVAMVLNAIPFL